MSIFNSINASASALTAQRLRMDVVSSNIANAQTTRATINENGEYEPYKRKMVTVEPNGGSFKSFLHKASGTSQNNTGNGVKVTGITEDETPFKLVYDPTHPDADDNGYVEMPNVDPLKEMVDLMSATRSYEANITSLNASKGMLMKALEIGK
ncbi:proximal rod protein [Oceanobacillus picturae]|uniref:Flagellar basal-body rod protein FlgC n=2 Tax=Oceanobacillus TaxID=182709 RepID=W9A908_9BACI|nr:flagellar basal body rod protein FlgC [Oceanobacillus picturae]AVQ99040.1 flagellar basal body rod protein FlgC [Oceanobacillus iheyensis]MCG3419100.1 flagellar basal body rod protein FlgC [Oceanobacillus jordanicus]NAP00883.1 flagellar basal body rod protein FlgC [Halomonas sp. MG34]RIU96373.1 flagellar basal body rod protein FlgC [Oceanobacillus picturae]CDO02239.1 Putative proximal rod protein [Oceanobacillus picturae]